MGKILLETFAYFEKRKTQYMKINAVIKYIKTCQKEELTPRFAKVNLALKTETSRLKGKFKNQYWKHNIKTNTLKQKRQRKS